MLRSGNLLQIMGKQMSQRHVIKSILAAVLLAGCSEQPHECGSFVAENIGVAQLVGRYPTEVGTNLEAKDWVDSSQFETECLLIQRPEFRAGMDYYETREARNGDKVFLFTPLAVSDTLIGFVQTEDETNVVVVGML
jgi:hypothetical protein